MQILASAILALGFFANAALAGGYTDGEYLAVACFARR